MQFRGVWAFNVSEKDKKDQCKIYGSDGSIQFSFYGDQVQLKTKTNKEIFSFEPLLHVEQPMIHATVDYFLGKASNPCSVKDGITVMRMLEAFSGQ